MVANLDDRMFDLNGCAMDATLDDTMDDHKGSAMDATLFHS